jgi:hypothetical protein
MRFESYDYRSENKIIAPMRRVVKIISFRFTGCFRDFIQSTTIKAATTAGKGRTGAGDRMKQARPASRRR